MNPELKTVPEPTDEERKAQKAAFNRFRREWNDWLWEHGNDEPMEVKVARFMLSRSAASPPQPVAGDEPLIPGHEAFRRRALAKAANLDAADLIGDPVPNEETIEGLAATLAIVAVGRGWTLNDDGYLCGCVAGDQGYAITSIRVAPPPPPADLKVEAKALRSKLCLIDICRSDAGCGCLDALADALSAAHAAGKAEGEADLRGRIAVLEHWQRANQHRIGEAERQHREALDGLAAARAEALEEAKRDLPEPYRHPNGIFEDGWNAAAKEAHEALRALISAPLPPREERP